MKKQFILSVIGLLTFACNLSAQDVYVLNAQSQLEPASRAVTTGTKTSGMALLSVYGAKTTTSIIIDGKRADLVLPLGANYFYVHTPRQIPIRSWKLAALKKDKKNTRKLPFAKSGIYTGSQTSIDDIGLRVEQISEEVYRLSPAETLLKGEYALFRMEAGVPAEVYDFSVDASLSPSLIMPKDDVVLAKFKSYDNYTPNEYLASSGNTGDLSVKSGHDAAFAPQLAPSDVDIDIPTTNKVAENTFALIISNENYKQVENVPFAHNDGNIFKEYLKQTLGVAEKHITHIKDASLSDIKFAMNRVKEISEAYEGDVKIIMHYSGHGIPDESSHEGYLLPADGYAADPTTALKLSELYSYLGNLKAKSKVLFLDACFSGAQRTGDMLASARGVSIKVKKDVPKGNLIVLSAAQGDQTAYPYTDKQHGLMTYFLLKKLQMSGGDVKMGELCDYVTSNVKKVSVVENGKSQIPVTTFDANNKNWKNQTLR